MKKWTFGLLLMLLSSHSLQADGGVTAFHKLRPGETLWFVSQVYYGDGNQFAKLIEANHLSSVKDVDVDQELQIPNPLWVETMPQFASHYQSLAHKRDVALQRQQSKKEALRAVASEKPAVPLTQVSEKAASSGLEK